MEKQGNKIFVGGLNVNTTEDGLKDHFSQYGEIVEAMVMREKDQGQKSRGFGFVTFESNESMRECLKHPHLIDTKDVEVKKAIPKEECRLPNNLPAPTPTKKVFLGGLPLEVTKEQLLEEMRRFGDLIDAQIMTDKHTNKPRGFGFAIFQDYSSAEDLCRRKYVKILDRDVEVKLAVSQDEMRKHESLKGSSRGGGGGNEYGYGGRGGGDPYSRSGGGGGGGGYYKSSPYGYGGDYGRMAASYDYSRYDYMRGADYMGGGGYGAGWGYHDGRGQANNQSSYYKYPTGYDMSAYTAMYPPSGQSMGTYSSQTASAYGPSRGGYGAGGGGGADKDKDRTNARGYHPYRR